MPLMKARQSHGWKQSHVDEGEEYEATDQEALLLEALGWAVRITASINGNAPRRRGRPPGRYKTADVTSG